MMSPCLSWMSPRVRSETGPRIGMAPQGKARGAVCDRFPALRAKQTAVRARAADSIRVPIRAEGRVRSRQASQAAKRGIVVSPMSRLGGFAALTIRADFQ